LRDIDDPAVANLLTQTTQVVFEIWYLYDFFCEVFNNLRLKLELI